MPPVTILDHNGRPYRPEKPAAPAPTSKYDASRTTADNRNHWRHADGASANAANSAETRRVLRNRARYEDENNSYANGLTGDRANETIGTGPRLQLTLPDSYVDPDFQRRVSVEAPEELARAVELRWKEWAKSVRLLDKLLVADESETREGESFLFKFVNPALPADAPQLDVRVYEADQIGTPDLYAEDANAVDGIRFDSVGNPTEYHVLKRHPGDAWAYGIGSAEYDRIPARQMVHFYKPRRAGQARGIPAFTSSLPLYAIMRRFTLASLLNAEAQARITGVIQNQDRLPDPDAADGGDAEGCGGDEIEFKGVSLMELDAGQEAKTFGVSHPAPAYAGFKAEILTECGRALNAPRNVSNGSSAEYNYSSGRLDQQQWQRAVRIRRTRFEDLVLENLFVEWLRFALLIPGYLPDGLPPASTWARLWRWDGFVSIDPVKDATAATERMGNGTSTLERECGELGADWEEVMDQRAREQKRAERLGIVAADPTMSVTTEGEDGTKTTVSRGAAPKAAARPGADVQATALNGAQVTAMIAVCDKLAAKDYSRDATEAILQGAFPGMDRALITTIVRELAAQKPKPAPAAPKAAQPATATAAVAVAEEDTVLE